MKVTSPNPVEVKILDKDYLIACPPEAEGGLRDAAHQLDKKMREIKNEGSIFSTEKIAIMAALNLTYELLEKSRDSVETREAVSQMHEKIDLFLSDTR
ncbi:MAG: cell division protein ZapA [Proteobacteria bacterium]|nr:MAG: cell division protein ZapA [Pseudomonadota bacterium]PIE40514.1 MAG: cell division protein ZapA [Gammaproteobacteria bacterium]